MTSTMKACSVEGCQKLAPARGLCKMHTSRLKRLGRLDLPSREERFWARVDRSGGPEACWPWLRYKQKSGHGRVWHEDRLFVASRVAWKLTHGSLAEELDVCHTCDNGECCNPDHLFLGTHTDNMQDKEAKGRGNHARGAAIGLSKLSEDSVRAIRAMRATGMRLTDIAAKFDVTPASIAKVALRRTWAHID